MATQQSTRQGRIQPTMLSQRIAEGIPTFNPINSIWSRQQDDSPTEAYDVVWENDSNFANHFHGYSIRVVLSQNVAASDLVLLRMHEEKGGRLRLATVDDSKDLRDATSGESIDSGDAAVVGCVAEEREFLTPAQISERQEPDYFGKMERDRAQLGLVLQAHEERRDVANDEVLKAMGALRDLPLYERLRRKFEADYAAKFDGHNAGAFDSEEEAKDFALRTICGCMFRAGQLAAAQWG